MNDDCDSMVTPIQSVMLKHPREAFVSQAYLEEVWQDFGYSSCPDFDRALDEYACFENILQKFIPEIIYQSDIEPAGPDAIYAHDAVKMTSRGAILMRMGKALRRQEPVIAKDVLNGHGINILGEIKPPGIMEGGDIVWLGNRTVALAPRKCVGLSGNPITAEKMRAAGVELFTFPGEEISLKGTGGATCLTCPILR